MRMGETMSRKVEDVLSDVYKDFFGTISPVKAGQNKNTNSNQNKSGAEPLDPQKIAKEAQLIRESIENELKMEHPELDQKSEDKEQTKNQEKDQVKEQAKEQTKEEKPKVSPMEELNNLIGLNQLKDDVKELINLVKMQKMREEKGLKTVPVSLHLVFTGNPGTGKTTIARILAGLYKEIGVLSKGQLVEVDRSSLVAGFVGQTATKTQEKLQEAMGGVLFIDEAYTLVKDAGNDFGQEAIDTILKSMEDHRDDLIVIVAGYPDLMEKFINSNPGLKSRFNKYFHFPDYNVKELGEIFRMYCRKYDYKLSNAAELVVEQCIMEMVVEKDENFANARSVRNLFETIITNQASRVAKIENPSEEDVITIEVYDIDGFEKTAEETEQTKASEETENTEEMKDDKEIKTMEEALEEIEEDDNIN